MDMSKYKGMFIEESREHLKNINSHILELEKDPSNQASINNLFREYHSIKGMAASMSYQPIMQLSHSLEDLLDVIRKKKIEIPASSISLIFSGTDALEGMIDDVSSDREIQYPSAELLQHIHDQENVLKQDRLKTTSNDDTSVDAQAETDSLDEVILEAQPLDPEEILDTVTADSQTESAPLSAEGKALEKKKS